MRKLTAVALTIILCLSLASCSKTGGKSDELALKARTQYLGTDKFTITAFIEADYGDKVYEYRLKYNFVRGGQSDITVLTPENIAGLKAVIDNDTLTLDYEGTRLETGELSNDGLTPIDALPAMLKAWQEAYILDSAMETLDGVKCVAVSYDTTPAGSEQKMEQKVWFDSQTYKPVRAETYVDGYAVIKCEFEEFEFS